MKSITLNINNESDLLLVKMISERMGIRATINEEQNKSKKIKQKSNGKAMANALEKIALNGNLKSIKNPVAWQKQQREDRKLPNR
ncbi:MAG: hypothetical protein ABI723_15380 [Bacteroidia bacterium]